MGNKLSLRSRLLLSVSGLVAFLLLFIGGGGYYLSARWLGTERSEQVAETVERTGEALDDRLEEAFLSPSRKAAEELEEALTAGASHEMLTQEGALQELLASPGLKSFTIALLPDQLWENGEWREVPELETAPWMGQVFNGGRGASVSQTTQSEERTALSVTTPLYVDGQGIGVLWTSYDAAPLIEGAVGRQTVQGGTLLLLDQGGYILNRPGSSHPQGAEKGKRFMTRAQIDAARQEGEIRRGESELFPLKEKNDQYRGCVAQMGFGEWQLLWIGRPALLAAPLDKFFWVVPAVAVAGGFFTALLMAWQLGALLEPVERMARSAKEMAQGRYTLQVDYTGGATDEFGELCRGMEDACTSTKAFVEDISHTLGRMAKGDFTVKTHEEQGGDFASVHTSINLISNALHDVFLQINETAKWGMVASHRVSGIAGHLATGNDAQTNAARELSKAATLLRHETTQNAQNAMKAQEMSLNANDDLRETLYEMRRILDSLRMLRRLYGEMADYMKTIREISRQTDLLCVKAAAEASRLEPEDALAFSFVTDELRALARQSEEASRNTEDILIRSRDGLECTTEYASAASDSVRSAAKKNGQANEFAGRVVSASQIQNQAATCVRKESSIIAAMAQVNTQVAEQCGSASETLSQQAKTLASMASAFYTKGSGQGEKSAPIIFDADSGDFSVTDED